MSKIKSLPAEVPSGDQGAPIAEGAKPPRFGVPRPVEQGAVIPRVIQPIERTTEEMRLKGIRRYKVRCNNFEPRNGTLYILARSAEEAKGLYVKEQKIDAVIEKLIRVHGKDSPLIEQPDLVVTELPD